jgi:glycosyltransferase involved in cell wall biosynthesis
MTIHEEKTSLIHANEEFRKGNYSESIALYLEVVKTHPELAQSVSINIAIAEGRLEKRRTRVREESSGHVTVDILPKTALPPTLNIDHQTDIEEAKTAPVNQTANIATASLEDILALKLSSPPARLLKTYDLSIEEHFVRKARENDKSLAARLKKTIVSIIMPTYNRASTLGQAIDSVIKQSHSKWQLIIIDDGSTDESATILKRYSKDKRIKVVKGDHKGVSAARNRGLEVASGEYIYYLDSDNTWTEDYLHLMTVSFLSTGRLSGYAAIHLVDEYGTTIGYRGEPFDWEKCVEANYVDVNTFAHHHSLLKTHGNFDVTLRRMVDWDLILRYTKDETPFYAPFIGCIYLESRNDKSRITLSQPLAYQKVVRLKNTLNDNSLSSIAKSLSLKIAVKIPAPFEEREQWGDYHYADSLRIALEQLGHTVTLDFHGAWYTRPPSGEDVVIVIRGLTAYNPRKGSINLIWNISHPDQVDVEELEQYDFAYVASDSYASLLSHYAKTKITALLQCSDQKRFSYLKPIKARSKKMLFVGNSRNEYRPLVRKAIEAGKDLAIYGTRWSQLVDSRYLQGENVSNTTLSKHYSSHEVVLNDHWESMREYGYVSNRIFDVLATGGTLISDALPSITRLFGDSIIQLQDHAGFESVDRQLKTLRDRGEQEKQRIAEFVNLYHSFDARARVISDDILARLGLPAIFSTNPKNDAGGKFYPNAVARNKTVGLLLEGDAGNPNHPAYIRLIGPLTTDAAASAVNIVILNGVDDASLHSCDSVIVQGLALNSVEDATKLIKTLSSAGIHLYLDVYQANSAASGALSRNSNVQALDTVMQHADHVWFSTARLALGYCHAYTRGSIIQDTIDPRFWRNYRKPQPRPSLAPKFRILFLANSSNAAGLEILTPALDAIYSSRGSIFELVVIGDISTPTQKPWLKLTRPTDQRRSYPRYAKWLMNAERFDIGVAPMPNDMFHATLSDTTFLHYSALGIPTVSSRSATYTEAQQLGLVLSSTNDVQSWINSLSLAMENRELMVNMADRAWKYIWERRNPRDTLSKSLPILTSETQVLKSTQVTQHKSLPNVAVCAHIYYVNQWPLIKSQLSNISEAFDLFITCTEGEIDTVNELILKDYPKAKVIPTANLGMDVLPFLQVNRDFSLWKYLAVLKIHTKNTKTVDDAIFGTICMDSLLPNSIAIERIVQAFANNHDIGLLGPELLYRSAESLMYVNANGVQTILNTLGFDYPKSDWGFFAGTMFWIRGSLLHSMATNFEAIKALAVNDSSAAVSGGDGTWAHAMERVFGALAKQQGMQTAAMYLDSPAKADWFIRSISDGEFHKSLSYRVSSKWHTARYSNLAKWSALCMASELFDQAYYAENSGGVIPKNMSPIAHFVLYGDDLGLNPSPLFSTSYYRNNNRDVVHARVPTLVHYLVHGQREARATSIVSAE